MPSQHQCSNTFRVKTSYHNRETLKMALCSKLHNPTFTARCPNAHIDPMLCTGSVAERSKALVLGTSLFGGVGSNPTAATGFELLTLLTMMSNLHFPCGYRPGRENDLWWRMCGTRFSFHWSRPAMRLPAWSCWSKARRFLSRPLITW